MTDMNAIINELEKRMDKLDARGQNFAKSLIRHHRGNGLTARQMPWPERLLAQTKAKSTKPVNVKADFGPLYAFIERARKHLKFPKIILTASLGGEKAEDVKVYMSGERSKNPDVVNIQLLDREGRYGRFWAGRIGRDGAWTLPMSLQNDSATVAPLKKLLVDLAKDPHAVASRHGQLTGNCCFCNRGLTDDRSTTVGYGPVCADKFGLSQQWKTAAEAKPKSRNRKTAA